MLYVGGVPFYGGSGGSTNTPVLRQPADGSEIDLGNTSSGTVSKTITVKGKNLTQNLTVVVIGTGFSIQGNVNSISAADANAGTTLTLVYTGNDTDENAEGTLSIASSEVSNDCDLIANKVVWTEVDLSQNNVNAWIGADGKWSSGTTQEPQASAIIDAANISKIKITTASGKKAFFLFLKTDPTSLFPTNSVAYASYLCSGESGRREQTADTTERYNLPSDCVKVMIGLISNGAGAGPQFTPQYVGVL